MRPPRGRIQHAVKDDFSITKALKKAFPFIWPRAQGNWMKIRVVVAIFLLLFSKLLDFSKPVALKWTLDALSAENPVLPTKLIIAYGFVGFGVVFTDDIRGIIFAKVAAELERTIALETFVHLQNLSLRFHLTKKSGSILRSVSRGASSFAAVMQIVLFRFCSIVFQVSIVIIYLLVDYDWRYTTVTCAVIVGYTLFAYFATEHRDKLRREMNKKDNEFNQKAVDALLNFETVKYFNSEEHEISRYDAALKDYRSANIKTQKVQSWISIGQQTFLGAGVTAVMLLAGKEVVAGTMSVGSFILVQQFILTLYKPLGEMGRIYRQIKNNLVDVEAMFDLFNETPEIVDNTTNKLTCNSGAVQFKNVNFSYEVERPILKNVSFEVAPGENVAIVGPSGSGKSTIARLLYRFYDIQEGAIIVDNQDIREVTQHSLRKNIAIVPQDCALFNESIGYNIGYGIYGRNSGGPSQFDVELAAEKAQIDKFITSQENGYALQVGERGLRISGGEKQRVAIARAILKDSKILIFDEATSSLDTRTEQEIIKAMDALSEGRSSITIAHRLSTIVKADKIIVLKDGVIVECGTHSELITHNGEYKEMWDRQAQKDELENAMEKLQTPFIKKSESRFTSDNDSKRLSFDEDFRKPKSRSSQSNFMAGATTEMFSENLSSSSSTPKSTDDLFMAGEISETQNVSLDSLKVNSRRVEGGRRNVRRGDEDDGHDGSSSDENGFDDTAPLLQRERNSIEMANKRSLNGTDYVVNIKPSR